MSYLIEYRFQSVRIKRYLKGMIYEINRTFHVGQRKPVPHISLVGPIETNNENRLMSDFARICSETPLMKLKVNGFGTFDSNKVVYVNVGASDRLNEFRVKLVQALKPYCQLPSHDKRKEKHEFGYHSTLAMKLDENEFNRIKNYIANKPEPEFTQIVMRITLLRGGRILKEYDFLQRKLLNRRQALNRYISRNSKELLYKFMRGAYDPNRRITLPQPIQEKSFFQKIIDFFKLK